MAEQTTIRADQIEGLREVIRTELKEVLREEIKPVPEDMDQLRRSPAGAMIRLESKVEALDEKVDQRFDALKSEMDQRFDAVDQRFDALESKMDQRFVDLKESMDGQFSTMKWVFVLIFSLLFTILGKLFLIK